MTTLHAKHFLKDSLTLHMQYGVSCENIMEHFAPSKYVDSVLEGSKTAVLERSGETGNRNDELIN